MKKLFLTILLAMSSALLAQSGGENLIANGTFDSSSGWKLIDARYQKDKGDASNRVLTLCYSDKFGDKAGSRRKRWTSASQKIHVKSETSYKLTFKARGISGGHVSLSRFSDANQGNVMNIFHFDPDHRNGNKNLTGGWKEFTVKFKTPKRNKNKRLIFWKKTPVSNAKYSFEIDDVVLVKE